MDHGATDTAPGPATAAPAVDAPTPLTPAPARTEAPASAPRRRGTRGDLAALALVGVLLVGALTAGGVALYKEMYSPTAFALRYLALLSDGRAADALEVPGVAIDSTQLEAAGLPVTASDALLRQAALGTLTDVKAVSETVDGDTTRVTVQYMAGAYPGTSTFEIERDGWIGVVPGWRFAKSPLSVIDLTVRGSMRFDVNGFEIDKRQVSVDGTEADPLAPIPMLVFSPGLYAVSVDTAISATDGVTVLADAPLAATPLDIQAEPTEEFVAVVQQRVDEFLAQCATQQVLQPTGCPFGFYVQNRIDGLPVWSIAQNPTVTVTPDGANWAIPAAEAVAHIEVDIRSLFDGTVRHVSEDVPFALDGTITVLPDGKASISIGGPESD